MPSGLLAQNATSSLFFNKRVQAYANATPSPIYHYAFRPSPQGGQTAGKITCDFRLTYNAASTSTSIVLNFVASRGTIENVDGSLSSLQLPATTMRINNSAVTIDPDYPADRFPVLKAIMGLLFFDLQVSGPADPVATFTPNATTAVISRGLSCDKARMITTEQSLPNVQTIQLYTDASPSPPVDIGDPTTLQALRLQPFTGTAVINKTTGLVLSNQLSIVYNFTDGQISMNHTVTISTPAAQSE